MPKPNCQTCGGKNGRHLGGCPDDPEFMKTGTENQVKVAEVDGKPAIIDGRPGAPDDEEESAQGELIRIDLGELIHEISKKREEYVAQDLVVKRETEKRNDIRKDIDTFVAELCRRDAESREKGIPLDLGGYE